MAKASNKQDSGTEWDDVEDEFALPWKDYTEGDSIEGTYVGAEEVQGGPNSNTFTSFRVKREDGQVMGISGAALETRMKKVPVGSRICITFTGTIPSKRGTPMKTFDVKVAKGTRQLDPYATA